MKQKLPEKKSSYKNLYLGDIQKTRILSTSWVKYSLLGLLITKFFNKKKLKNSFNFRMLTLSIDLRTLKKNNKLILNRLMLFTLPILILFYRSNNTKIVERHNFSLTKIQRNNYSKKNYKNIYKKSFRNFNQNFEIFLPNFFEKTKLSGYEFSSNIIKSPIKKVLVENKKNCLFEKKINKFIHDLSYYLFEKEMKNDYSFLIKKEVLQNLESLGEPNEILIKSSFFIKKNGYLDFPKYIKIYLYEFFTNTNQHWKKFQPKTFDEKNIKNFSNELKNPKLYLNLENILSSALLKSSKHLTYKIKKSKIQMKTASFFNKKMSDNIYILNSFSRTKKNKQFLTFNSFNKFYNLHTLNHNLKWIRQILHFKQRLIPDFKFRNQIFLSKFVYSLKNKPNSFIVLLKKLSTEQHTKNITNFFSQPKSKIKNLIFFEPLLIDKVSQKFILKKKDSKIFRILKTMPQLKNHIEFDDIEILSCKVQKYHSDFLFNIYLPSNFVYNTISQKNFSKKNIVYIEKSPGFFIKIFNLVRNCINLKEYLLIKNKQLDLIVTDSNKIKEQIFSPKIFLVFQNYKNIFYNRKKLIKSYFLFKDSLYINFYKYCNKILNKSFFELFYLQKISNKNIFNKNSRIWKRNFQQNYIYNIQNSKYESSTYWWLYKMRNLSKNFVSYDFFRTLKNFFQSSKSNNINKIFKNISNTNVEQNNIFNKILIKNSYLAENVVNNNLIDDFAINEKNCEIPINLLLTTFSKRNTVFLDDIKSEKLFINVNNYFFNFRLNYKKNFLFYLTKNTVENYSIIYLEFLKNFIKHNKSNENFQLTFTYFLDLSEQISKEINLLFSKNSKISLSKKQKNIISIKNCQEVQTNRVSKDILLDLNNIKIKNYYSILLHESLHKKITKNSLLFQAMSKISLSETLKNSKLKTYEIKSKNRNLIFIDKTYKKFNLIENFKFFKGDYSIKDFKYTFWFFTQEWWEYCIQIVAENLVKQFIKINTYFAYLKNKTIKLLQNNLRNLYENKKKLYNFNSKWNSRFFFECKDKIVLNFVWLDYNVVNNLNNLYWAIFTLITFVLLFYQNYFSIFIGSNSINLWLHFENIKYLTDTSQALYFTELLHRNKIQFNKTENILIYFVNNLKHYIRNIRFYLITKKKLNKWLENYKSLDVSRRKRNLLVQSLTQPVQITEYGFQFYSQPKILNNKCFGYSRNPQQGLSYLRYLSRMFQKNLVNYSLHQADKWVFFASLQKIISSQTLQQTKNFNPRLQKIPLPVSLGLSCSKGILLIGPTESGRSYLMKNLAADSSVPLLGISINKLMYNKPDFITESWMNILIESLRRLNLILDLAKGMSPCLIWIQNIHQLDVNRSTQNIESDPTFLLGVLLKHFQTDSFKIRAKNKVIMIGSTHLPKKVDPSLISPDRLDRILNIRLLNRFQRKNQFLILLNKKNFQLKKNLSYFTDFGSRTMGYNIRDLAALTNEISLISLTKNKSFIYDEIIKLAFNRQVLGFSHTNNKPNYQQNFKILLYKIGKAIIQNMIIQGFTTNPLNISNYLLKRKFYYLSKWYLEPSIDDSIIKESTILANVLGCLAGIAARDSWFLLQKDVNKSLSLDKSIENDLDLAFSILETLSSDFSWLETCENLFFDYKKKRSDMFLTKNFLNIMHKGIFAIANKGIQNIHNNFENEYLLAKNKMINRSISEFNNTTWSPRFWRLNFCRSHLFNWIKRPNDFTFSNRFGFYQQKNLEKKNNDDQFLGKRKEQLFYERILPRVRKRNVEELESQFENILLEEQFEILGFFNSETQYQMEYQINNKPRLFIGKRVLWDPIVSFSQFRHFVFSSREFFVDEEMLRRLYITYGVRRERERSLSSHRIKRFFLGRGYNKDLINKLSVRWWNQLPIDQKHNIYTLKRIEKIGIRLKRPQIFTPVYLYQRWLIENIPGKFSRLDLMTHRDRWIKINKLFLNNSLTYNILLESYQYLLKFFLSNKLLLNKMTKMLLKKKWIFQNEIVSIIHSTKNNESL
jgi:hypothetical protein